MKPDYMIDTSSYDSRRWDWSSRRWIADLPINWEAGRGIGLTAASLKASEGMFEDPAFKMNWRNAAGRPREAWHFFRQNINAIAQAEFFLSVIGEDWNPETDQASIDWETTDGKTGPECLQNGGSFLYEVEKRLKVPAAIYTYPAYWRKIGGEAATWAGRNPLHLAQWPWDNWLAVLRLPPYSFGRDKIAWMMDQIERQSIAPVSLQPWGNRIMAWQFTARARTKDIPGHPAIKTVCDLNVIFQPWWKPGAEFPPPPPLPENSYRVNYPAWVLGGPGNQYRAIRHLDLGEVVYVEEIAGPWAKLSIGGYVAVALLTKL